MKSRGFSGKRTRQMLGGVALVLGGMSVAHAIGDSGGCADPLGGPLGRALKTGKPQDVAQAIGDWVAHKQKSQGLVRSSLIGATAERQQAWRREQALKLIQGIHEKGAVCVPGPLLPVAVLAGNVEVVRFLLHKPLEVQPQVPGNILFFCNDSHLKSGVDSADAPLRRRDAFALVLDSGKIDLNATGPNGRDALHTCHDPELLELFLERGARLDTESVSRFEVLDQAVRDAVMYQEGSYTAKRLRGLERARLFSRHVSTSIRGRPVEAHVRRSCNLMIRDQRWNPETCRALATFIKAAPGTFGD